MQKRSCLFYQSILLNTDFCIISAIIFLNICKVCASFTFVDIIFYRAPQVSISVDQFSKCLVSVPNILIVKFAKKMLVLGRFSTLKEIEIFLRNFSRLHHRT